MRIGFHATDWEAIERLWSEFYPEACRVDAEILRQNTIESPVFDWGASAIEVMDDETLGFVAIKRSANPTLWPGKGQDTFHLSAICYREPEIGIDLLSEAKRVIRERGGYRLAFGTDSGHFWPGLPLDCAKTGSFLMVEGFEPGGGHFDLERDLATYERVVEPTAEVTFRELQETDVATLGKFLSAEFPGRWRYDTLSKVKEEGAAQTCFGAFEGGRLLGFALIQDWRHRRPIGGGVWRVALGERWGSLGPIGVAKSERGRGLGHALLGEALMNLKGRGVERCIIDWTTLDQFYGRHGFEITRRYQYAELKLD